jgi:hypothetical protein
VTKVGVIAAARWGDTGPRRYDLRTGRRSSKLSIEQLDRLDHCISEFNKAWDDRFDFSRPELLKRYLRGELCLYVHLRQFSGVGHPEDFCAGFGGPDSMPGPWPGRDLDKSCIGYLSWETEGSRNSSGGAKHDKQSVLVGNVERSPSPCEPAVRP